MTTTKKQGRGKKSSLSGIVRYNNRKLFDYSKGRYVTLGEVFGPVLESTKMSEVPTVTDYVTGEDLTDALLTSFVAQVVSDGSHHLYRNILLVAVVRKREEAA